MTSKTRWNACTLTVLVLVVLLAWMCSGAEARPQWTMPASTFVQKFRQETMCDTDSDLLEICQRCAKATKSTFAYPMCCTDQEKAISWCKDYLFFGIQ